MWRELLKEDLIGLKEYADIVLKFFASDEYYEELSEVYLARQLVNKGNNLHYLLYEDGTKQMIFGLKYSGSYPNPYTHTDGMWKVVDLAYLGDWGEVDGNGVSQEAVKFGTNAVREYMDRNGIPHWYCIFNMDIRKLDTLPPEGVAQKRVFLQFLKDVQKEAWEITETKLFEDGTHYVAHFNRDPAKLG